MKALLTLIALMVLVACASTGVVPMGKDTFMVSKQSATGYESAVGIRAAILQEANAFCQQQGLVMVVQNLSSKDGVPGRSYATAELIFLAVRPDDPRNRPPNLEREADQTIEIRKR